MVSDSLSSALLSLAVSVPAVFVVRSLIASDSEYGDEVRKSGMTSPEGSDPLLPNPLSQSVVPAVNPVRI